MRCTLRSTGGLTATSTGVLDRHAHRLPYAAAADQQRIVSGLDLHNGRGVEPLLHDDRARVIGPVHQPGVVTGATGVRVVFPRQDVLSDEVLAVAEPVAVAGRLAGAGPLAGAGARIRCVAA